MYDLLVTGGDVFLGDHCARRDVAVNDGKIVSLDENGAEKSDATVVIDATGRLVLPGGVDPHCHYGLDLRGITRSESQEYSFAAAIGGTTTIIDFALQSASQSLAEAIAIKKSESCGHMAVDFGLHAILTGDIPFEVLDEIGGVIQDGVPTIKTFMIYDGWQTDDGVRWEIMTRVAKHGGMSLVHAEDDELARSLARRFVHEGKVHGAYISEARGPLVEEAAIRRAILLAERSGSPLYILHVSSAAGVNAIGEARERGVAVYGETLPTYLCFTEEYLWDDRVIERDGRVFPHRGLLWNNFPTLKTPADRQTLWDALADDRLQMVGSDHASFTVAQRYDKMGTSIDGEMQGGHATVELRVPLLFSEGVREGRISLARFVDLVATTPAKLMGLFPQKGQIAVGADADMMILDPTRKWTVRSDSLHMASDFSPWEGWEIEGKVVGAILRGEVLVDEGEFVGSRTAGEFLPRRLSADVVNPRRDLVATKGSGGER